MAEQLDGIDDSLQGLRLLGVTAHLPVAESDATECLQEAAHLQSIPEWAVEEHQTLGSSVAELEEDDKRHWRNRNAVAARAGIGLGRRQNLHHRPLEKSWR